MVQRQIRFSVAFAFAICLVLLVLGTRQFALNREADELTADGAYLGRGTTWFRAPRGAGIKFRQLPNGKLVNGSKEYTVTEAIDHADELSSRLKAFGANVVVVFYEDGKGGLKELESVRQLAALSHQAGELRNE